MTRWLKFGVILLLCMASPLAGVASYEFCKVGNWLLTFVTSGLAYIFPVLAWYAFGIKED